MEYFFSKGTYRKEISEGSGYQEENKKCEHFRRDVLDRSRYSKFKLLCFPPRILTNPESIIGRNDRVKVASQENVYFLSRLESGEIILIIERT